MEKFSLRAHCCGDDGSADTAGRGDLRRERGERRKKEKQKGKSRTESRRENLQMQRLLVLGQTANQLPNRTQLACSRLLPPAPGGGGNTVDRSLGVWDPPNGIPFCSAN